MCLFVGFYGCLFRFFLLFFFFFWGGGGVCFFIIIIFFFIFFFWGESFVNDHTPGMLGNHPSFLEEGGFFLAHKIGISVVLPM